MHLTHPRLRNASCPSQDFGLNAFEQLCINFANEKLQQLLVERIFKAEAKLYNEEGVPLPGGAQSGFADNLGCVELLSGSPNGVFRLLDSQCISPQATDAKFIASVNQSHARSTFLRPPAKKDGKAARPEDVFVVKHYAGDVVCAQRACARERECGCARTRHTQ